MNCMIPSRRSLPGLRSGLPLLVALAVLAGSALGQIGTPGAIQNPGGQSFNRGYQQQVQGHTQFDSQWVTAPRPLPFAGFPATAPAGLSGFGSYPVAGQAAPGGLPILPLSVDEPPDWPRWLRTDGATPLPYVPEQALLVRHAERVWWKSPDDDVFVPLYFYDKVRSVVVGTEVEVRQSGEFEVLFHAGGRLVSQGQVHLRIETMDEKRVALLLDRFTNLRMVVSGREYTIGLPDGSTITVPADVPPATPDEPAVGPAQLVFGRAMEPGRFGGRAAVWNGGERPVQWHHAFGEETIQPGQRVQFFLLPVARPIAAAVVAGSASVQPDGPCVDCRATSDSQVSWCGARFALPKGSTLRLDPLQGEPFRTVDPAAAAPVLSAPKD